MPKPSNSQTIDRRMDNDDAYGASNAKQTPSNISDFLSHTESTARRAIAIVLRASGPLMKGGYYSVVVYYETPQRFSPRCWPPSGSEDLGYGSAVLQPIIDLWNKSQIFLLSTAALKTSNTTETETEARILNTDTLQVASENFTQNIG